MVYPYEDNGPGDWMSREFFSGGLMPSHNLLLNFQDDLKIEKHWKVSGMHYSLTSYAWLDQMDSNRTRILKIFDKAYGSSVSKVWFHRWRIFFLACAELFQYNKGKEWHVGHYLFKKHEFYLYLDIVLMIATRCFTSWIEYLFFVYFFAIKEMMKIKKRRSGLQACDSFER